jgi:hypothetical protein
MLKHRQVMQTVCEEHGCEWTENQPPPTFPCICMMQYIANIEKSMLYEDMHIVLRKAIDDNT